MGRFPVACGPVGAMLGSNHIFMGSQISQLLSSFRLREEQPLLRWRDLPGDICLLMQTDHLPSQLESNLKFVAYSPLLSHINQKSCSFALFTSRHLFLPVLKHFLPTLQTPPPIPSMDLGSLSITAAHFSHQVGEGSICHPCTFGWSLSGLQL